MIHIGKICPVTGFVHDLYGLFSKKGENDHIWIVGKRALRLLSIQ